MLDQMSLLSVGPDTAPEGVRSIYLQYLNLAHFDFYNETALLNDDVMVSETLMTDPVTQKITLSNIPLNVSKVYDPVTFRFLEKKSLEDFIFYQSHFQYGVTPHVYTVAKQVLTIYPLAPETQYTYNCLYVPQPVNLLESTDENDIPYPLAYHGYLVDGALYYLFQDEEGFKSTSKSLQHQEKFEKGKSRLLSYLINSSNKEIRTFSNV